MIIIEISFLLYFVTILTVKIEQPVAKTLLKYN